MAISALSIALWLSQRRRDFASFIAVNAFILLGGAIALWWIPQEAGSLIAFVFVPLVAAPLTLANMQSRYTRAGRLEAAARCADLAAFFHPTRAMRLSAAFSRASAIPDPREKARALGALAAEAPAEHAASIEARLCAERGEWDKILVLSQHPENARQLSAYRIRALGEAGHIEDLMRDYACAADSIPLEQTPFAWLFILAFAGRPRDVSAMATRMLRLDADTVAYWTAVALRNAGDERAARAELSVLAVSAKESPSVIAARRLLARDWTPHLPLSPRAQEIADGVAGRVAIELGRQGRGWLPPPVTLTLILTNAAMFIAEIWLGGSQNAETLISLGALWAPLAMDGEGWRVLTAAFLHYGILHFALNMLMLALIGRDLEHEVGSLKTLVAYLGGALFSSVFVLAFMERGIVGYGLYVGASGAIFALFGVIGALRVKDWLRHRASLDAFRATALGFAMLVQVAADFLLPMSSLTAHLSGFGFGLAVGVLISPKRR